MSETYLAPLAFRADLLAWELEGTCGYGSYQWWKNGKKVRYWEEMEGRILQNDGPPLNEGDELGPAEVHAEDRVFRAMAALAIPLERILERQLTAFEFPRIGVCGFDARAYSKSGRSRDCWTRGRAA